MSAKKISLKESHQKKIIQELLKARDGGFILRIDLELDQPEVKIIYDPDNAMYKNEWSKTNTVEDTKNNDLDNIPSCRSILVKFSDGVKKQTIKKIAEYVSKSYFCKHTIYENNRLTFYDFK
jgi:hypothetical protein